VSAGRGCLLLVTLVLTACAAVAPREPPTEDATVLWQQRAAVLEGLSDWSFNGRAAVSGPDVPSRTVRVNWAMSGDAYHLAFMSVLGQRVAELNGDPAGAELRLPREEPRRAAGAEELLADALGWTAPLDALRYWVIGLPAPAPRFGRDPPELDAWGRLVGLEQEGWRVDYAQYTEADGLELPRRMTLDHPRLRIRLVIDEWNLGSARGNASGHAGDDGRGDGGPRS